MNRRILLVDDEPDFLAGVRQLLAPRFEVTCARSGAEALARAEREGGFAVVVSDHGLSGMSGVELLAEFARSWPETARILLTGNADLGLALEALERGAIFRFLTKPPEAKRLLAAVAEGVARHHAVEEERAFTEQLCFARESLQTLNGVLEQRLERELEHLDRLAQESEHIASSESPEDVLERTSMAMRELLGSRAPEVRSVLGAAELEIVPSAGLRARERRTLSILASQARGALASTRRRQRAHEAQRATLHALVEMARQRDDATGVHQARVSEYVRLLATGLRASGKHARLLTDEFVESLAQAAPLHDIGKVAIPDSILLKTEPLDEGEWEVMRTHAAGGAEILRSVQAGQEEAGLLELAREIAWTHHERWDGQGYPRRLAREAIPLSGRILALADTYDALTSERPYKRAWTHAAAVARIVEERGLAFDPDLVDVFLARQEAFAARRELVHGPA